MAEEPEVKRAIMFFDGQNLYRHAKTAFNHHHPNYDPVKLSEAVCTAMGWDLSQIRFYTGTPKKVMAPMWHGYWERRLKHMRRLGIIVTSRTLHYRDEEFRLPDGKTTILQLPREKGIDLRLGLDAVRLARNGELDVAVIFSQDQDLAEVAREYRDISRTRKSWLKIVSAYPQGPKASSHRGIDKTDWFPMDREFYDACLDPRDYRHNR